MRTLEFETRLLSRPVRVHWAGWTSDTLTLQQNGWSLSAHQDIARMALGLAIRHEAYGQGVSQWVDWNYQEYAFSLYRQPPDLHMHVYGRPVLIETANVDYAAYRPIDAVPQMTTRRTGTLEDFVHFAPSLTRTHEIIVPEDSVDDPLSLPRAVRRQWRGGRPAGCDVATSDGPLFFRPTR